MARALIYTRTVDTIFVGTRLDHNSHPYKVKQSFFNPSSRQNTSANLKNNKFKHKNECIPKKPSTCSICFVNFLSEHALKIHKNKNRQKYKCDRCNATFSVLNSCTRHMSKGSCTTKIISNSKAGYVCYFCSRLYKEKTAIQGHLFHIHGDLIHSGKSVIEDTFRDTSKLNDSNDTIMKNVNNSNNKSLKRMSNLNGMMSSSHSITSEVLNGSYSQSLKRVKQTTSTDFILYKEKLVEDSSTTTNITDTENITISNSPKTTHKSRNKITETCVTTNCDKAPTVNNRELLNQMCTNFSTMMTPLNNEIKTEPDDPIISYDTHCDVVIKKEISHSSLDSNDLLLFEENENSEEAREYCKREKLIDIPDKNQRIQLQDNELKSKFKCKECKILLERCNEVLKFLNSRLGKDENTSDQVDSRQIVQQLKDAEEVGLTNKFPPRSIQIPLVTFDEFEKSVVPKLMASKQQLDIFDDNVEVDKRNLSQSSVCKKSFFRRKNMRKHMEMFYTLYTLSTRNTRYKFMNKLLHHYLSRHIMVSRKECCVCYKKFNTLELLKHHILLHCMKTVQYKQESVPVRVKTKCIICKKQHKCKVCRKRFSSSADLKQHVKVCRQVNTSMYKQNTSALTSSCVSRQDTSLTKSPPSSPSEKSSNVGSSITDIQCVFPTVEHTPTGYPVQMPDLEEKSTEVVESTESAIPNISTTTDFIHLSSLHTLTNKKRLINRAACVKGYQIDMSDMAKFPCKVCSKQFQKFQNLCIHESIFCKPATNVCSICSTAFSTKRLMQVHIFATHTPSCTEKYKFFCKFCNQGFSKKANVLVHERHFHSNDVPKPWLSVEQFSNVNNICRVCNLMFQSNERFIEHTYYYENQTVDCPVCKKSFQGVYKLHQHNKLEHYPDSINRLYVYKCNICNEGFNYESHLHAHKVHVHSNEATSTPSDLNIMPHLICTPNDIVTTVESEQVSLKRYICGVCDLNFVNEKDLLVHKIEYSTDGDFQCNQCKRKCGTSLILAKHHSLNHTDYVIDNSFKCRFCGEVLTTNISMRCHEKHFHRENTDVINNNGATNKVDTSEDCKGNMAESKNDGDCTCLTCGMKFSDNDKLKDHLFEYSDIGEYTCTLCQRKFTELKVLEAHKMKHTTLNTFLYHCPVCNEGFGNFLDIHTHVSHFHRFEAFSNHEFANEVDSGKTTGSV